MSNKALYTTICAERKSVPLFMQPWWLDAVCACWDAVIAKKGEHITGLWAYPLEKKMGVVLLRNPVLTPYLGPFVFFPADMKESNRDSFEHEAIAGLIKQLPAARVWRLAVAPNLKQVGLFKQYRLSALVQQTFLLSLREPEETLLANMKENARRNIRQAEKEISISDAPEHLADLYAFQQHTLSRKGRQQPYTLSDLERIVNACRANNAAAMWTAKEAGKVQAIVWEVWDETCSYYLMGGQNPQAGGYKAMTLLLWHAIKQAKGRGQVIFDFEGSMDEGVERFFRNFGGERSLYLVLQKNESLLWKLKTIVRG